MSTAATACGDGAAVATAGDRRPDPLRLDLALQKSGPAALADLRRDPIDAHAAAQREGSGLAPSLEALAADPDQEQLPLVKLASRRDVGLAKRQRVGDDLDLLQPHGPMLAADAYAAISSPAETSRLKTPSRAPVPARAPFSAGPSVRLSTARAGLIASGRRDEAEQRPPRAAVGGEGHEQSEIGAADQARGRAGALRSRPMRTASVRLPARRSVSMSRTLLTTRIAVARQPTAIESPNGSQSSRSSCT